MKTTILRDKFDVGMRVRLDDLNIEEFIFIKKLIENELKNTRKFVEECPQGNVTDLIIGDIKCYENMLKEMINVKTIKLDCLNWEVEEESFQLILKKYKKMAQEKENE